MIGDWGLGTGDWGLGNSGPPLGIRGNGDWEYETIQNSKEYPLLSQTPNYPLPITNYPLPNPKIKPLIW
ncbi:hypothetical protein FDUTEX481_03885 [Tolypothrix sp. PCC 7601]|nr:hypothetical protein FDUTEX481_03885 [Tolypothrix sp. PCC 7601]